MISTDRRRAFEEEAVRPPHAATIHGAAIAAKAGDAQALAAIAAALVHCAFAAPETALATYAALRSGWLGGTLIATMPQALPAELSPAFWNAFWDLQEDRDRSAMDALAITDRVVALGTFMDPALRERCEAVAANYPKAAQPALRTPPPRLTLNQVEGQPVGSLAHDFWRQIVDNKFDLEVLDRETMNLSSLPPALCYLNTRILQMHDIWHLAGGFRTTALHEIAISAFQQAQFGHGYSAMFLAVVVSGMALRGGDGAPVVLQTIAEASQHGWDTPGFMGIAWEDEWHRPLSEIRARHGIRPFSGSYPADFFERQRSAA